MQVIKRHYVYFPNVDFLNYNNPDFNSGELHSRSYPLDRGWSRLHHSEVGVRLMKLNVDTSGRTTFGKLLWREWCIRETCIWGKGVDPIKTCLWANKNPVKTLMYSVTCHEVIKCIKCALSMYGLGKPKAKGWVI